MAIPPPPPIEVLISMPSGIYYVTFYDYESKNPVVLSKLIPYSYQLVPGTNYGTLQLQDKTGPCVSIDPDGKVSLGVCNPLGNQNQYFTLTTNGRWYSVGQKKYLIEPKADGYTLSTEPVRARWLISELQPNSADSISLWNTHNPGYKIRPEQAETMWWSERIGSPGGCPSNGRFACSAGCVVGSGKSIQCDPLQTTVKFDYDAAHACTDRVCLLSHWPSSNLEPCVKGDPSIKVDGKVDGKIDIYKCKMLHAVPAGGELYEPSRFGDTPGAWAPWTADSTNTDAVKTFSSQIDTLAPPPPGSIGTGGVPMFASSRFNLTSGQWCRDNPTLCNGAKSLYCSKYTSDDLCVSYCGTDSSCLDGIDRYCTGSHLEEPVCVRYCGMNKAGGDPRTTNCDLRLQQYCQGLGVAEARHHEICGCFLGAEFYENYFKDISAKYIVPGGPSLPDCYFPLCAASTMKTYNYKSHPTVCPNVSICVSYVDFTNNGHINGDIKIETSAQCSEYKPQPGPHPPPCTDGTVLDKKTNTCIACSQPLVSNPDHTMCIPCSSGYIPNADRSGCTPCPDGTIVSPDGLKCISGSSTPTFWSKYGIYIIIGIIVLVLLLIIIGVIVSRRGKKVPEPTLQSMVPGVIIPEMQLGETYSA